MYLIQILKSMLNLIVHKVVSFLMLNSHNMQQHFNGAYVRLCVCVCVAVVVRSATGNYSTFPSA